MGSAARTVSDTFPSPLRQTKAWRARTLQKKYWTGLRFKSELDEGQLRGERP